MNFGELFQVTALGIGVIMVVVVAVSKTIDKVHKAKNKKCIDLSNSEFEFMFARWKYAANFSKETLSRKEIPDAQNENSITIFAYRLQIINYIIVTIILLLAVFSMIFLLNQEYSLFLDILVVFIIAYAIVMAVVIPLIKFVEIFRFHGQVEKLEKNKKTKDVKKDKIHK